MRVRQPVLVSLRLCRGTRVHVRDRNFSGDSDANVKQRLWHVQVQILKLSLANDFEYLLSLLIARHPDIVCVRLVDFARVPVLHRFAMVDAALVKHLVEMTVQLLADIALEPNVFIHAVFENALARHRHI